MGDDLAAVRELITDAMRRAGADAMSEYDERFETRFDMVDEVFLAMLSAAPRDQIARIFRLRLCEPLQSEKG